LRSAEDSASAVRRIAAALALGSLVILFPAAADPTDETPGASAAESNYAAGKKAVEAHNWNSAIGLLNKALLQDDRNPDIQNLLGYAYRNAGNLDLAFMHYGRALQLNPRHRGAHEYLGEAYLLIHNPRKAEEHLAALRQICLIPCSEYEDLEKAVAQYNRGHSSHTR
jgi:Flp pilus assembly protein TadD